MKRSKFCKCKEKKQLYKLVKKKDWPNNYKPKEAALWQCYRCGKYRISM